MDKVETAIRRLIASSNITKDDLKAAAISMFGATGKDSLTLGNYKDNAEVIDRLIKFFTDLYDDPLVFDKQRYQSIKYYGLLKEKFKTISKHDAHNLIIYASNMKGSDNKSLIEPFIELSKGYLVNMTDEQIKDFVSFFRNDMGIKFIDFPNGFISKITDVDTISREEYLEIFDPGNLLPEIFMAVGNDNRVVMHIFEDIGYDAGMVFKKVDAVIGNIIRSGKHSGYDVESLKRGIDALRENIQYVASDNEINDWSGGLPYISAYLRDGWDMSTNDETAVIGEIERQFAQMASQFKEENTMYMPEYRRVEMILELEKFINKLDVNIPSNTLYRFVLGVMRSIRQNTRNGQFLVCFISSQKTLSDHFPSKFGENVVRLSRLIGAMASYQKDDLPIKVFTALEKSSGPASDAEYREVVKVMSQIHFLHVEEMTKTMIDMMRNGYAQGFAKYILNLGDQKIIDTCLKAGKDNEYFMTAMRHGMGQ